MLEIEDRRISKELPTWADGRFVLEIEDRRISKELPSDEQSADRLSFTAAIYNC